MKKLNDLEYLQLSKFDAFLYKLKLFFCAIPLWFKNLGLKILRFFANCILGIKFCIEPTLVRTVLPKLEPIGVSTLLRRSSVLRR